MRLTAILAGVFLCAVIFSANTPQASAEVENSRLIVGQINPNRFVNESLETDTKVDKNRNKPVEHLVVKGETLVQISKKYEVKWKRIFDKNLNIDNPDVINPGEKILIPNKKEKLKERVVAAAKALSGSQSVNYQSETTVARTGYARQGSSAGNTYSPGYCTYYAKQRRPDLPNNLGNAATWVSRALAQGIPTGSKPRVGAIGQSGNHVVYVEKLNSNGTIVVSDMNWSGLWNVTTRTVSASSHTYIY